MPDYANTPTLTPQEAEANLKALPRPWAVDYLAMYSTWLGGVVTEPWLMNVPLDDHMVHRGDAVFEASKCLAGRIYQFEEHLQRLARSASSIKLELPLSLADLRDLAGAVVRAGGEPNCLVRIYISRGPGGFTTNPFECPQPGVYLAVGRLHPPDPRHYEQGVEIGLARVPAKDGFFAAIKSCNYLPNVLLKREAVKKGWDFAVGLDEDGRLGEGSTENFGLVDAEGFLLLPEPDRILEGITVKRAAFLARQMADEGLLAGVERRSLTPADLDAAREVMLFGTTLDVLPVTRVEGRPVADGKTGPAAAELGRRLRADILHNPDASTPVFA
jgi:branched-chain amino acid aminotransferase